MQTTFLPTFFEKDLWVSADEKFKETWQWVLAAQANYALGCIKSMLSRMSKVILPLCSSEIPAETLCSVLGCSA